MAKTAMQELIMSLIYTNITGEHNYAIEKAKQLLEKEKQQIVDAYHQRETNIGADPYITAEDYYNKTYNQ